MNGSLDYAPSHAQLNRPAAQRRRSKFAAVAIAAALAVGIGTWASADAPATREAGPDLSAFTQSVHVPFAHLAPRAGTRPGPRAGARAATGPIDFEHLQGMNIRVSVNGGPPVVLQVDTGSDGIIMGASDVPNIDPKAPPGQMLYISSGNELDGVWTPATVTFLDSRGPDGKPVTAQVPVLAAQESRQIPGAVNGSAVTRPVNHNPHAYMCGVGFARGKESHPERNPFLNLTQMRAGTMRRGYAITRDGYTLGLTAADAGPGYVWQHLKEREVSPEAKRLAPGLKDWDSSTGWIVVNGHREAGVPMLIDTGLTNFIIWTPGLGQVENLPRGTQVEVNLLGGQLHYRFSSIEWRDTWSGDPAVPSKVSRTPTTAPVASVNTGLRTLAIYDYLYDADGGYLGLRPTAQHP
jgi:hypothetical protein